MREWYNTGSRVRVSRLMARLERSTGLSYGMDLEYIREPARRFSGNWIVTSSALRDHTTVDSDPNSPTLAISPMWRFTRNNGITEGFRTKMEVLQR